MNTPPSANPWRPLTQCSRQPTCWGCYGLSFLLLFAGLWADLVALCAETVPPGEYQVKAAILYKLTKYVDWPPPSFPFTNSPLILVILGQDNFGDDFKRMIEEKAINGRKLVLKRMAWGEELKPAHLIFVSASEKKRLPEIMDKLRGANVLTVGESDSFIALGGMINLAMKDNKIRPEVNLAATERAHLQISSKLLSIAQVVGQKPGENKN